MKSGEVPGACSGCVKVLIYANIIAYALARIWRGVYVLKPRITAELGERFLLGNGFESNQSERKLLERILSRKSAVNHPVLTFWLFLHRPCERVFGVASLRKRVAIGENPVNDTPIHCW